MANNKMDFQSDEINIFCFLLDESGSMESERQNVVDGMNEYVASFEDFEYYNSISISVNKFSTNLQLNKFVGLDDLYIEYNVYGNTALYDAIIETANYLIKYRDEVIDKTKINPRVTFVVFSDGEDNRSRRYRAGNVLEKMRELEIEGVTTVFVAFGSAITSKTGEKLGFLATKDVKKGEEIRTFFREEFSESCKEQSRSVKALGSDFFSHAADSSSSAEYSKTAQQALNDADWIDDI